MRFIGGDTVTVVETLTVRDTIHDTTIITAGKAKTLIFGMIVSDSLDSATSASDSIHASLTAYTIPYTNSLVPSVNGHTLTYTRNQKMSGFFDGFSVLHYPLLSAGILSSMTGATYETRFLDSSTAFSCSVAVPYYESDTTQTLSLDTLCASISLPTRLNALQLSHDNGIIYDSVDFFTDYALDTAYRILLDKDLEISWSSVADWYAVQIQKYSFDSYGIPFPVGKSLDTASIDTQIAIPHAYIYQDTAYNDTTSYYFLDICVIPVNGPSPNQWDSLTAFNGNGYLFAFRSEYAYANPNAIPFLPPQAKASLQSPGYVHKSRAARSIFGSIIKKRIHDENTRKND